MLVVIRASWRAPQRLEVCMDENDERDQKGTLTDSNDATSVAASSGSEKGDSECPESSPSIESVNKSETTEVKNADYLGKESVDGPQSPDTSEATIANPKNLRTLLTQNKKRTVAIAVAAVIVVAIIGVAVAIGPSASAYLQASQALDGEDYKTANELFIEAGNFLDAPQKAAEAQQALDYESATEDFNKKAWQTAGQAYADLQGYKDSTSKAAECAEKLLESENYEPASAIFGKLGEDYAERRDYANSMAKKAKAFKDAISKMSSGQYSQALDALSSVPDDFAIGEKTAGAIKAQLTEVVGVANTYGTFKSCDPSGCSVKQTSKNTSNWHSWETTEPITGETLTITPKLNNNGSITIEGTVSFYRYTNFATISSLIKGKSVKKTFNVDGSAMPASIDLGDGATLTSNDDGSYSLDWSEYEENHDLYFNYAYEAHFTYRK